MDKSVHPYSTTRNIQLQNRIRRLEREIAELRQALIDLSAAMKKQSSASQSAWNNAVKNLDPCE